MKYSLGQRVSFTVSGELEGIKVEHTAVGYIRSAAIESNHDSLYITYGIVEELPSAGNIYRGNIWKRKENEIKAL
jgi:hypothetical protein